MSYPPRTSMSLQAEEYELQLQSPTDASGHVPVAGPSRPKQKTFTIHPSVSTSALLFSGPSNPQESPRRRKVSEARHAQETTPRKHRPHFLHDDTHESEEVHVPDFGHMLGMDDVAEDHLVVADGMRSAWKKRLYLLMEAPNSSREAFYVHVGVTGAILFSALVTTVSTLPAFHTDTTLSKALFGLDTTLVVLFTVEYLARTFAHSDSWAQYYTWATSFFALLDLVAILPYYIEVVRHDDTSILFRFSILRTFRLLRVFRAFKYQSQLLLTIEVMYVSVQRSKDALVALSFFILLVLVFFSTLIYFAERGTWDPNVGAFLDADGDPSLFDSIPQTAWFALVTMSTVGYGDVIPRSMLGKLLTVPLLMFGLLLIALPSFVLGRNFAIVFDAMTRQAPLMTSMTNTPRASFDVPTSATPLPAETDSNQPLLPTSADFTPTAEGTKRGISPMPISRPGSTQPGSNPLGAPMPRMWDGGDGGERKAERDLTNVKLAKNQMVLLEQIDALKQTIDRQGEMLDRLMSAMGEGSTLKRRATGKQREEEQFALGSDDDL